MPKTQSELQSEKLKIIINNEEKNDEHSKILNLEENKPHEITVKVNGYYDE